MARKPQHNAAKVQAITPPSPWMTTDQVADYLSVSPGTIRNWISQRYIPFTRRGRIIRFHREKIDFWLAADICEGRRTIAQKVI